jgi:ribosomal protein S18 acetylase RimI-like enzyme
MQDILIRLATVADLAALLALEDAVFATDQINRRQMRYLITRAKAQVWVMLSVPCQEGADHADSAYDCVGDKVQVKQYECCEVKQLLGYAVVLTPCRSSARLYSIAVDQLHQGFGLGKKLLVFVIAKVQALGYKRLLLEVRASDQKACNFYQNHSFVFCRKVMGYYQDGEAALRMVLSF